MVKISGHLIEKKADDFVLGGNVVLDYINNEQPSLSVTLTINDGTESTEQITEKRLWIVHSNNSHSIFYYQPKQGLIRISYLSDFNTISCQAINKKGHYFPITGLEVKKIAEQLVQELKEKSYIITNVTKNMPSVLIREKLEKQEKENEIKTSAELKKHLENGGGIADVLFACREIKPIVQAAPEPVPQIEPNKVSELSHKDYIDKAYAAINNEPQFAFIRTYLIKMQLESIYDIGNKAKSLAELQRAIEAILQDNQDNVPEHLQSSVTYLRGQLFPGSFNAIADLGLGGITFNKVDVFWITWFKKILSDIGVDISQIKTRVLPIEYADAVVGSLDKKDYFTSLSGDEDHVFRLLMRTEFKSEKIYELLLSDMHAIRQELINPGSRVKIYLHSALYEPDIEELRPENIENRINTFAAQVNKVYEEINELVDKINTQDIDAPPVAYPSDFLQKLSEQTIFSIYEKIFPQKRSVFLDLNIDPNIVLGGLWRTFYFGEGLLKEFLIICLEMRSDLNFIKIYRELKDSLNNHDGINYIIAATYELIQLDENLSKKYQDCIQKEIDNVIKEILPEINVIKNRTSLNTILKYLETKDELKKYDHPDLIRYYQDKVKVEFYNRKIAIKNGSRPLFTLNERNTAVSSWSDLEAMLMYTEEGKFFLLLEYGMQHIVTFEQIEKVRKTLIPVHWNLFLEQYKNMQINDGLNQILALPYIAVEKRLNFINLKQPSLYMFTKNYVEVFSYLKNDRERIDLLSSKYFLEKSLISTGFELAHYCSHLEQEDSRIELAYQYRNRIREKNYYIDEMEKVLCSIRYTEDYDKYQCNLELIQYCQGHSNAKLRELVQCYTYPLSSDRLMSDNENLGQAPPIARGHQSCILL